MFSKKITVDPPPRYYRENPRKTYIKTLEHGRQLDGKTLAELVTRYGGRAKLVRPPGEGYFELVIEQQESEKAWKRRIENLYNVDVKTVKRAERQRLQRDITQQEEGELLARLGKRS